MMTSKERMEAVIQLKEPDRVPVWIHTLGATRRVTGVKYSELAQDGELAARCILEFNEVIGDDFVGAYLDIVVEAGGFGQPTIFLEDEAPASDPQNPIIKSPDDYFNLEPYDVNEAKRCKETTKMLRIVAEERGEVMPVCAVVAEPLVILGHMRGMGELLIDCITHPDAVQHSLKVITDVIIDYSKALVDAGAEYVLMCHDYGNQSIMSEKMWVDLEGDELARWQGSVKQSGAKVIIHNCGNNPYIDAAFEIGEIDMYQLWDLPKTCSSWAEFKETYGKKTCIMGHINPAEINEMTPEELKAECKRHIDELGKGGGYLLGPGCEFPSNASLVKAKAMVDAAKEYGRY